VAQVHVFGKLILVDQCTDYTYAITVGLDGFVYACGTTSSNLPKTFGTGFTAGSWTQRTGDQTFIAKVHPNGTGAAVRQIGSAYRKLESSILRFENIANYRQ
jgi:hypothetical protein